MIQRESLLFKTPIRAQLTTSNSRTDTYFAYDKGERYFIKGPFKNEKLAKIPR